MNPAPSPSGSDTDPVLDAHLVLPGFYRISGGPSPISIRDQMLRGSMLSARLIRYGLIGANSSLLVIGAGAGGAVAALKAALNQPPIPTDLVDKAAKPFQLQRRATTRFLDPTQYDWALDHWNGGNFPWSASHEAMPLPYPSGYGDVLAGMWETELNRVVNAPGSNLRFDPSTEVTDIDPVPAAPLLRVTFAGGRTGHQDYAAVIWAGGAGREECRLFRQPKTANPNPLYEGRAFWGQDPFALPSCGIPGKARVLIVGGGDGALQDYLRIVTQDLRVGNPQNDAAITLYRQVVIPAEIASRLQSAEDRAHRGRIWANEDRMHRSALERPFLSELHAVHQDAAEDALSDPNVSQNLSQLFMAPPTSSVTLAYREKYFTAYYGLNRFLVLLIAEYLLRQFKLRTLYPETTVTDLSTNNTDRHQCMQQVAPGQWEPSGGFASPVCHGLEHEVSIRGPLQFPSNRFNVIIVRYGAREDSVPIPPLPIQFQTRLQPARPRHLLPYHLPR